jgi:multicomponent Na+:H+ antiporter subunit C
MEGGSLVSELFIERLNYCIYVVLLLIGLWAMLAKRNLVKKLIGMSIFQTAIILFYVSIAVKKDATIPIYLAEHDPHGSHAKVASEKNATGNQDAYHPVELKPETVKGYANPLPHVLMLTAIVVGVATLGLALALTQRIYQGYGTVEEDELLVKLERADERTSVSPVTGAKPKGRARSSTQGSKAKAVASSVSKNKSTAKNSSVSKTKKKIQSQSSSPRKTSGKGKPKPKS